MKEINNTILILYLRDKDGNLIHKIINNLRSGEVYDQVFYKPAKLDFDTEGFELIRYPSKESSQIKETLLFKDIEGNIRIVIDIFDALRIHESFIQRTVLNDGVLLPEYEFVLNTLAEIAKNQKIGPRGLFYRLYDIYPEPETVWGDNLVSIESAQAGDTCCYSYGWCPPECSSCIECSGGGGGVGGGDPGGGGGGGGSWNEECLASIAGPTLVFSNSLETYTLSTTCPDPYGITWYGGYGLNNGGLSYTTFWDSPGVYIVSVHFTISETVGITVDDDNNPDTPPKIYFQIVTVGKSASLSVEVFDEDQDIINPPRPSDGENLSIRIINVYSPSGNGSFVAKRLGDGDIINIYGEAFYGEIDLSNQIIWSAIDYPGDGIDSGSVIPSTSTGAIYSFVPSPPPAPAGRTGPLKYIIRAQITYNGITKEASTVVSQDNLDELRQEYEDIVACTPQPRWVFDTEPAAFPGLLATAAEPTRFQWHILRNLNQYAAQANSIFIVKGYGPGINFTSGYRTPRGNYLTSGSAANSNHLYGRAFDFQQSDSWGNYYAYLAAYSAGARADTYLLLSNNNDKIFWRDNPPAPNNLPPGINYVRGHAAWGQ